MTPADILALPVGRVLKRWINPKGRHYKVRVVKPNHYFSCDFCGVDVKDKAFKTEAAGNVTLSTACAECTIKELKEKT